jgi:hypothetical protein
MVLNSVLICSREGEGGGVAIATCGLPCLNELTHFCIMLFLQINNRHEGSVEVGDVLKLGGSFKMVPL